MSLKKAAVTVSIALSAAAASSATMAQATQDAGWYIGGGIGQAKPTRVNCLAGSCDDKDIAWKLFGGYQLNRMLAAELGYTDLGDVRSSGAGATADATSKAWELVGLAGVPVADRFSAFGKLGLYRAASKQTGTVAASKTNTGATFGLGVRLEVNRNLGVRAEWQRYNDVGGGELVRDDINVVGVAFTWKF